MTLRAGKLGDMITSRTPDPDRSCALLIGASVYDSESQYESVASAAESAVELGRLLATPDMWGLSSGQVKVMSGRITTRQAAAAIEDATGRPGLDGLFVYICSHGRTFTDDHVPDKNLHFAFADSDRDWSYTHLPFLAVRRMLTRRNEAPATLLVIDSCNAGGAFLGPSAALIRPQSSGLHPANVATIIATSGHEQVPATLPGSRCTPFASMFIEVVKNGIADLATEFLTPDAVRQEIGRKLRQVGMPMMPDSRSRGSLFVCKNHAYQYVATSDTAAQLMTRLEDPKTIDTSVYASALETQHAVRPGAAMELAIAFGSRRTGHETFALATALRSHGIAKLNDYAEVLIGRIYACRPAPEVVALMHQHAEDPAELDVDAVSTLLTEQPDQVAADVCAAMREISCRDCEAISRRFDDRMISVWPADRRIGLLSALH
jgi:hypothetical protein